MSSRSDNHLKEVSILFSSVKSPVILIINQVDWENNTMQYRWTGFEQLKGCDTSHGNWQKPH
jgi:hypothetical protein